MSIIKIEFPADRPDIALALSTALQTIGTVKVKGCDGCNEPGSDEVEFQAHVKAEGASEESIASATSQDAGSDDHGQFTKTETEEQDNLVDPANTDTKGVPFNAEFCGKAAKPYYASGKRSGQWKKRQGVDELVYDNWYAAELAKVATSGAGQGDQAPVNTASAFSGQQQQEPAANNEPAVPHDAGTLMAWVSEMQAANRITQQQVNEAYQQAGVTMTDVFPGPNKTEETIAQAVRNVYTILVSWAQ